MAGAERAEQRPSGNSAATLATDSLASVPWKTARVLGILKALDIELPKSARILDFGCGSGSDLRALQSVGYVNVQGYDVAESSQIQAPSPDISLGTELNLMLPYEDDTFDLVISDQVFEHVQDQVRVFSELFRVTKPGGHGLHVIPAPYEPKEGHINVPFGGVLQHRWWYKLWAKLGIRNRFQLDLSADETADWNAFYAVEALRYVPTSCYRVMWPRIGFEYQFVEQAFFDTHARSSMRAIGKLGPATWLYRTFRSRIVYLHKPETKSIAG